MILQNISTCPLGSSYSFGSLGQLILLEAWDAVGRVEVHGCVEYLASWSDWHPVHEEPAILVDSMHLN